MNFLYPCFAKSLTLIVTELKARIFLFVSNAEVKVVFG